VKLFALETTELIAPVLFIAIAAHIAVRGIRLLSRHLTSVGALLRWNKLRTLADLFQVGDMI
jgi:hypothetical protein